MALNLLKKIVRHFAQRLRISEVLHFGFYAQNIHIPTFFINLIIPQITAKRKSAGFGREKFALLVALTAANFLNQIFFVRRC